MVRHRVKDDLQPGQATRYERTAYASFPLHNLYYNKRKNSELQYERFERTVHDPPEETGIDAPAWTLALVPEFLGETDRVEYLQPPEPKDLTTNDFTITSKKRADVDVTSVRIDQTRKYVQVVPRNSRAVRGRASNSLDSVTGRVCSARSPKTVSAYSHGSPNTPLPIIRDISLSYYTKNSKITWSSYWTTRRIFRHLPSRIWRPVTTLPSSRFPPIRRNSILSQTGDSFNSDYRATSLGEGILEHGVRELMCEERGLLDADSE